LSKSDRKPVDVTADYLLKYKKHMRYNEYLANGYPIASGMIEATCKHLIADRFEITGATWGLTGSEALLKMRAIYLNGDETEYWNYHIEKEQERINSKQRWTTSKDNVVDFTAYSIKKAASF
jgi:hypothetical protein